MQIEVITIGNEILSGAILDTNFSYIAKRLAEEGYTVSRHTSIPDDTKIMEASLLEAIKRSELILTTGGLGPTLDDKTKEVMAHVFQKKLVLDLTIEKELIERYGKELTCLKHQATVPSDTDILKNHVGTAPGFLFRKNNSACFVMPGVPLEMQAMFEKEVLPHLKKALHNTPKYLVQSLHLCHLPEQNIDPYLRALDIKHPEVEKGIYPGYGVVSVEFKVKDSSRAADQLQECIRALAEPFQDYLFSMESKSLSLAVHHALLSRKKTLVLAESCTGGHIAAQLVDHPGASEYFLGGIVCYSNQMKEKSLRVQTKTLHQYGAVSPEVVQEMLQGALDLSGADYALAVSGVFGPSGGSQKNPIGTVWCGLAARGENFQIGKILAKGRAKRTSMIEYTTNFMLGVLWRKVVFGATTL